MLNYILENILFISIKTLTIVQRNFKKSTIISKKINCTLENLLFILSKFVFQAPTLQKWFPFEIQQLNQHFSLECISVKSAHSTFKLHQAMYALSKHFFKFWPGGFLGEMWKSEKNDDLVPRSAIFPLGRWNIIPSHLRRWQCHSPSMRIFYQ